MVVIEIIQEKLRQYGATHSLEEENATKEIMQEIALYAFWQGGFFDVALFKGGTSLRILHGLPRFSEDLDFILRSADTEFNWTPYLRTLTEVFKHFGLKLDAQARERMDKPIREAVLKDDSIASQLDLTFADRGRPKTIKIKLEIDTNPPSYSGEDRTFLDFPLDYEVAHQDLASNFALKIHALLCRPYLKGRDWYDFSWYVAKRVKPNLLHLKAALVQAGPWKDREGLQVDMTWLVEALSNRIGDIEWRAAAQDVSRFLRPVEHKPVQLWSGRFFLSRVEMMASA